MEEHGHVVTGMNNQMVWGMPHVFAIFMIVAASGVLNVASIGSVFGKTVYKPRAPLSGLLCLAMLAGGLMVLMLDLGRPERMIVAATHYNFNRSSPGTCCSTRACSPSSRSTCGRCSSAA